MDGIHVSLPQVAVELEQQAIVSHPTIFGQQVVRIPRRKTFATA
jgi:hypothetical protein